MFTDFLHPSFELNNFYEVQATKLTKTLLKSDISAIVVLENTGINGVRMKVPQRYGIAAGWTFNDGTFWGLFIEWLNLKQAFTYSHYFWSVNKLLTSVLIQNWSTKAAEETMI